MGKEGKPEKVRIGNTTFYVTAVFSGSVQLQMLRYYAREKGFEIVGEYVDDGISGTTFNRPDLNRMIEDAMNEYYARDTSKKIRSVKKTMALNGGFVALLPHTVIW